MKIINVVGARPNFMKIAPLVREMEKHKTIKQVLVHTGQHYDKNMSKLFFTDLKLPKPDIYLGVGSGTHAEQTAKVMMGFEKVLIKEKPDLIIVVGDVNSTIACSLVSAKIGIPIAHVEAGLRSFDRTMPEEINRILCDTISDYLFVTERSGFINLLKEGIPREKIHFVGNVMIDSLLQNIKRAKKSHILDELNLEPKKYALLTLHRPSNVDNLKSLKDIFRIIECIKKDIKIVYPIHPRSKQRLIEYGIYSKYSNPGQRNDNNLIFTDPLGYLDFMHLMNNAKIVLTDSGGIQEETTVLGVPCLTLRNNTERPVTIKEGTNILVGTNKEKIIKEFRKILNNRHKKSKIPKYWDGHAAKRIVKILLKEFK